jgi:hypothetical protein
MIIALCIFIVIVSILFLIGWFFHAIDVAQQRIDEETKP